MAYQVPPGKEFPVKYHSKIGYDVTISTSHDCTRVMNLPLGKSYPQNPRVHGEKLKVSCSPTGLDLVDKEMLKSLVSKGFIETTNVMGPDTIIITSSQRRAKVLQGIFEGMCIVTPQWIKDCYDADNIVPIEEKHTYPAIETARRIWDDRVEHLSHGTIANNYFLVPRKMIRNNPYLGTLLNTWMSRGLPLPVGSTISNLEKQKYCRQLVEFVVFAPNFCTEIRLPEDFPQYVKNLSFITESGNDGYITLLDPSGFTSDNRIISNGWTLRIYSFDNMYSQIFANLGILGVLDSSKLQRPFLMDTTPEYGTTIIYGTSFEEERLKRRVINENSQSFELSPKKAKLVQEEVLNDLKDPSQSDSE